MKITSVRIALAALLAATAVGAQVPPDLAARIRAAGQSMDPATGQIYAPLFPASAWRGVTVRRDIAYGADPLQRLDVYTPAGPAHGKRRVLLFVHGGGFRGGDKHGTFQPDNMTLWAAKQGMIGVNIDYRLAPAHIYPAAAQDLAAAIAWTRANAARFGGDPDDIVLFGHSAGANHVADYVAHGELHGPEFAAIRGAALLSPVYTPAVGPQPHIYYGADASLQTATAQIERLRASPVPLFVGYAEYDPDLMKVTARSLLSELCKTDGRCPRSVYARDHNHFTEGFAIGTADQTVSGPLLDWINRLPRAG
ncbi:MAG: alpha/beta hydrolase [Croceibacterium sp.]